MNPSPARTAGGHALRLHACVRAVALVWCIVASGCSRSRTPSSPATPEPGGTLHVGILESIDFLSPALPISPSTASLLVHVTPPLGEVDELGHVRPRLARGYQDSGAWLDFRLRPVRWEDGVPVTTRDLVLTTELMRDHRVGSRERARLDLVRDVIALDDSTLRFVYSLTYARRLRDALVMPIPAHALPARADPSDIRAWPLTQKPLACGPFRLVTATPDEMVLQRNEGSGFQPARLDRVVVRVLGPQDAVREFRQGSLDVIDDLPPQQVRQVRGVPGARVVALVGASYSFIGWNLRDGRFADVAVRRAAAQAVDVRRLIETQTLGLGDLSRGPLVALQDFADTAAVWRHDPKAAERLLDHAGWRDSDGDGVRDRRGARLEFGILVQDGEPRRLAIAEAVARDLRRVGMHVDVHALRPDVLSRRLAQHEFEAFVGQWFPRDADDLDSVWRSDAAERSNYVGYASPGVDSLLTQLQHEIPDEARAALWAHLQTHVYADQPYLFLFQSPRFLVLSGRVHGAEPKVVSPFWNLPEWWIPRRQQAEPAPQSPAPS